LEKQGRSAFHMLLEIECRPAAVTRTARVFAEDGTGLRTWVWGEEKRGAGCWESVGCMMVEAKPRGVSGELGMFGAEAFLHAGRMPQ